MPNQCSSRNRIAFDSFIARQDAVDPTNSVFVKIPDCGITCKRNDLNIANLVSLVDWTPRHEKQHRHDFRLNARNADLMNALPSRLITQFITQLTSYYLIATLRSFPT